MIDLSWDDYESIACGEIGLNIDYFYRLTFRQFMNICNGYYKKQKFKNINYLIGVRKLMWACLLPYQKKGFEERDVFCFDFEDDKIEGVDLLREIEEVEKQKKYWEEIDSKSIVMKKVESF
ncbi:hypothetical protein HX049_08000 [Myroides odoratimimus]|uniref:hypothetical protein n=1 Tax=Myroides odoratimimus TaxID=76832 RepID=UPI00257756D4|nr:hypothetical protein [Myroides odoratimimus]MDM1397116.1 hypothetical protein [Myroides odoratimimus]